MSAMTWRVLKRSAGSRARMPEQDATKESIGPGARKIGGGSTTVGKLGETRWRAMPWRALGMPVRWSLQRIFVRPGRARADQRRV